jgi:predicted porin
MASAHAGDLGNTGLKDPIPDSLNWHGVTIYGTVDVGYAYQTHGAPLGGAFYPGLEYNLNGSRNANRAISSVAENGLEQSKIGVKIAEAIGYGSLAIGKIETAFNPVSGELADACASMIRNNGRLYQDQNANSDGSRCGQAFNGSAYGGVSNPIYGTLTVGRQSSLELDSISAYEPMGLAPAFALLGYSGGTAGGFGATETARWDESVKYVFTYGPAHAAAMYTAGGSDTAIFNGAYGFNAGAIWKGFAIDAVYTETKGAVVSTSIPNPAYTTGIKCSSLLGNCPNGLLGTISDNEGWSVMGKYTYEFGGGLKDEEPSSQLTAFAGYVHIDMGNPHDTDIAPGSTTIGGYRLVGVTTNAYTTDKILQTFWTGAKYQLPSGWSFTGAYYRYTQDEYINNKGKNCATAAKAPVGNPTPANCAGYLNQGSFLIDYVFNKHWDVYAGISYIENGGGLNSAYLNDNMVTFVTGMRLKF